MSYRSGGLSLRAYVDEQIDASARRPAVLYMHGGFAYGADDWHQAKPLRDAGFVTMIPVLRGENGQPGDFTLFLDEVDDVLAARDVLVAMPGVDRARVYAAGHSAGGVLAMLAAQTSAGFRKVASFSGMPDTRAFQANESLCVFDCSNEDEIRVRSPLDWGSSFTAPVRLYFGSEEIALRNPCRDTATVARGAGIDAAAIEVPGDHFSSVEPAMQRAIAWFREDAR